jgi:hypothetical protein
MVRMTVVLREMMKVEEMVQLKGMLLADASAFPLDLKKA